ncbi:MAG: hypothetical protein LAP21_28705, partial [Acidobacteriia bacterium]|nr:hypothetical protein [Terriglobia bacterium]
MNYQALSVRTNFGCNQIAEYSAPNQPLLTSIVFPDQSSYTFTYESTPGDAASVTGRIASITLPTGATINYAYTGGSNGIVCDDGSAAGINVTTSDGGTWQYSRSGSGTQWTTTLTDPAGNQTLYSFSGIYQKQVLAYSGAVGGSAAFSMFTCYNIDTTTGCVQGEVFPPILEKVDQVQLDNAQTGFTKTFYDSGLPTEVDQYHYGSGQAGPLARRTVINYASLGNRIFDRQSDVTVFDANGNQVAKTTFSYDDTNLTATSGLPQHVPVAGSRGNLTHRSEWLNTSNSFLTTTYNYFDTGMLQSVSDPGGHVATFSYDSSGAYVSQLALPDTSSPGLAHHIISAGYDTHTGLVTSGSDENGNLATFFYDSRLRPTQTNLPDGGQTTISYPDPRHVITRQTLMDPFATFSQVELDSYGRVSRMVVANGETAPFDFDTQDSCYDFMGRLVFQSYPLQNAGLATAKVCSGAGDIYSYDALGRILSLTHSDGSSVQYRYAGRATQITDEGNAVSRILQADALGRLTQVCEVSNNTLLGSGGIPTSCGLDIAATGFLTSYSYDTLDNLTTVTQGSLTNRSYAYDSLGRMISETEPEWGSNTSYAYDNDGLQVQRIRPAPNQTDPNVKVTTTYTYDALHRPLSISYDDGKTDGAHFNYDERSVGVAALNNSIGRMTSAANSSTGTINSFDSIGRIVTSWQRTPSTATPFQLDYRYDSAGNLISSTSGAGATFSYSYNTAGRLTSMLSSTGDANHPPQLLSNVHYGAFGMVSAALGNGVQESAGFTPRGQLNSYAAVPPPNAHNYQGFVDHAGCDTIFGWAADRNHLNTSITVTIYDNGIALPAVLANAFRSDVAALLGDNGLHGFGIPTPTSMLDGRTHQVNVKFENSGTDLGFSPVSLTCVTISVLPQSASLFGGQTQTFTANVAGTSNTAVTWSIDPSSVGSISAAGVYTAPASVTATQTVIAKATSNADPSRTATATITLNPPVSISVSPTSATLVPSETLQLVATVGNTSNTAVTWSLNPNNIGTISAVGLYTAPASVIGLQTVVVTATSQADPSKSASAPIRVGVFQVSPPSVLLQAGQTAQFSATYGGSPATVTWSINPPVGTISTGGLYTAPTPVASAQTVTVSAADGFSHTASATISLVPVVVTVLPPAVSLTNNQTQQFTANVTGSTNTGVTWFLNPNVGTISSAGLYTAPASISAQQTVNAIATSSVDPSKSNFAVITLNPPVSISVSPTSATLVPNETLQLVATVGNTSNTAVTWSLNTNIGTISAGGLYTAPASVSGLQTVVATATSVADPSKFASTPIRVGVFQVSPPSVSLQAGQTAQFSATYGGSPATVTWSIKPVVGTISSGGLYTAPTPVASAQTVKVTATDGFSHSTSATISLVPVAVTVLPPTVSLTSNQTQQFTANVTGSTNTGVTWSLNPNVGTISSAGLYTAPSSISTQQTVTVTATSLADSSKTGSAAITLNPAISITIFPLG